MEGTLILNPAYRAAGRSPMMSLRLPRHKAET